MFAKEDWANMDRKVRWNFNFISLALGKGRSIIEI